MAMLDVLVLPSDGLEFDLELVLGLGSHPTGLREVRR